MVKDLSIFVMELVIFDNVQIILLNGQVWGVVIINFLVYLICCFDLIFGIDYGDDVDKVIQIILDVVNVDEWVYKDFEFWVCFINFGDSFVDLGVCLWCDVGDYWELKFYMLKIVKEVFDVGGILIFYLY